MAGTIKCNSIGDFLDCIEGLVVRGLVFEADHHNLKITLTGGY